MVYTTKIEIHPEYIETVRNSIGRLKTNGLLEALFSKHYTLEQVTKLKNEVDRACMDLRQARQDLLSYGESFINNYALDNKNCFSSTQKVIREIKHGIKALLHTCLQCCPRTHRKGPVIGGRRISLPALDATILKDGNHSGNLFGTQCCDPIVDELCKSIDTFFSLLYKASDYCLFILRKEQSVMGNPEQSCAIYESCIQDTIEQLNVCIVAIAQGLIELQPTELDRLIQQSKSREEGICKGYHGINNACFTNHALGVGLRRYKCEELTEEEFSLWKNNKQLVLDIRYVIANYDSLMNYGIHVEGRAYNSDKGSGHKLSSKVLAAFMKWCKVTGNGSESKFVKYFLDHYNGRCLPITEEAVNQAKLQAALIQDEVTKAINKLLNDRNNAQKALIPSSN